VLAGLAGVELTLNRILTEELRPTDDAGGLAYRVLDSIALFSFYLVSALALFALAAALVRIVRRGRFFPPLRYFIVVTGAGILAYAALGMIWDPSERTSLLLQICFGTFVLSHAIAALFSRGQLGVRIGLVVFAIPLVVHVAALIGLRSVDEAVLYSDFPETMSALGLWAVIVAASLAPYCFGARPFGHAVTRRIPLIMGVFVGLVGAFIIRQDFATALRLAGNGLGIELSAGMSAQKLSLAFLALGAITWTIFSCLTSDSASRRQIGLGISLIILAGYGFQWPMMYLLGAVGLLSIGESAATVSEEESATDNNIGFQLPPVDDEVWSAYLKHVSKQLSELGATGIESMASRDDDDHVFSHLVADLESTSIKVSVERHEGAIRRIDILIGEEPAATAPNWTLRSVVEGKLKHPAPPTCEAPVYETGHASFDRRFLIHDDHSGALTNGMFDDTNRERAAELLDGWLCYWLIGSLQMRIYPGLGAPLDHPVPISELAFRGTSTPHDAQRIGELISLLVQLHRGASGAASL
jgi:hypothetical protein